MMTVQKLIDHLKTLPAEMPVLFEVRQELIPRFVDQGCPSPVTVKRLSYPTGGDYYRLHTDRDEGHGIDAVTF